jgi:hypothetical protein
MLHMLEVNVFICMVQVFYLDVAYVESASFKCFSCFRRILLLFHVSELRSEGRMDFCVRARNGAHAGGPRMAFFLGNAVGIRHAHDRLGPGTDNGVKSTRM